MTQNYDDFNIILISLDGMRHDKIHLSENIRKLIKNSVYFSNMYTVSPYTLASHHAIFSGMQACQNGVDAYFHMFRFKKDEITTLTELLQEKNYYTCCDIGKKILLPEQGFNEFNVYDENNIDFQQRHEEIISRLSKKEKFFLFLQYNEQHKNLVQDVMKKYDPKNNDDDYYSNQEQNEKRYDSYMPDCDKYVGKILEVIKKLEIDKKTIVILFSDHGTSLGERKGERFYGVYLYDYTLSVFCIINIPEVTPHEVKQQCRTIDIFPTIANFANINLEAKSIEIPAKNLWDFIEKNNDSERELFAETGGLYGFWPSRKKHNVFCVRKDQKKIIYNMTPNTFEFYDLVKDPSESNNIYDENNSEISDYKEILLNYLKKYDIKNAF